MSQQQLTQQEERERLLKSLSAVSIKEALQRQLAIAHVEIEYCNEKIKVIEESLKHFA